MVTFTTDFDTIMRRVSPVLHRITYRAQNHSALFNNEDLYQEALVHLWEDYNAGKLVDKTDSYILQGCYFHIKNFMRTHVTRARVVSLQAMIDDDDRHFDEPAALQDEASVDLRGRISAKMLAETIMNNGFTQREKELLRLYSRDMTVREIGARMGISHVMVVKMMAKIREQCKKYLDEE
jgi:RNA polymerase sigma factor (sigma-70 family)